MMKMRLHPGTGTLFGWAFALLFGLAFVATPASAQIARKFPADALRGALIITNPPDVALNGAPARLAPGARIRGPNNLFVLSGSVAGQKLLVHYTFDNLGLVKDVWILTPDEAAKRPWPTTPKEAASWEFDASAQTWTRK
jgi:hypothetical protein